MAGIDGSVCSGIEGSIWAGILSNWDRKHTESTLNGTYARKAYQAKSDIAQNDPINKIAADLICAALKDGMKLQQIADKLNAYPLRTSAGAMFTPTQISRIRDRFCVAS